MAMGVSGFGPWHGQLRLVSEWLPPPRFQPTVSPQEKRA